MAVGTSGEEPAPCCARRISGSPEASYTQTAQSFAQTAPSQTYIYIYVYMYVYVYNNISICIYTCRYRNIYIEINTHILTYMNIFTYLHIHT